MKYRFKTEEEFIKEFGGGWRQILGNSEFGGWCWPSRMDNLFGTELKNNFPDNEKYIEIIDNFNRIWYITKFMLKECKPSYEPRKIIKEI